MKTFTWQRTPEDDPEPISIVEIDVNKNHPAWLIAHNPETDETTFKELVENDSSPEGQPIRCGTSA